jgi:hypothetical protein
MAFIRNVDKLIEGLENKFFTEARAKAALAPELTAEETARLAGDAAEAAARQAADSSLDQRLQVIEGSGEGSVAKAEQDAKDYADQKVAALVNSAPEVLDTLKELSDALGGDENFAATVAGQIGVVDAKVEQEILDRQSAVSAEQLARESADQGLDGRLDILEQDPTTKTYVDGEVLDLQGQITQEISDRQSAVSSEESARQLADSNLSGRISVLEQDPTTKSYVDGEILDLQGQITQEVSDRQSAVSAEQLRAETAEQGLDGRLDVLEQDPTTKSYVDAEILDLQGQITQEISDRQVDVNEEEQRAMSAESALDSRLDVLEGADTVAGSVAKAEKDAKAYADSLNSAMDSRVDALEADPVTKSYVDGEVSNLQGQVTTEKGRIDAILSASEADKDSFAEIVQLINSIDTSNDSSFAAYVLSNDAALAQEVSDRTAEDLTLFKKDGSRNLGGNLLFSSDNTYSIGAKNGSRVKDIHASRMVFANTPEAFVDFFKDNSWMPQYGFTTTNAESTGVGVLYSDSSGPTLNILNSQLNGAQFTFYLSNNKAAINKMGSDFGSWITFGRSNDLSDWDIVFGPYENAATRQPNLVFMQDNIGSIGKCKDGTYARPNGVYVGTTINLNSLSGSRVVVSDGSKNMVSSSITTTQLGYLSGVTASIQTQLDTMYRKDGVRVMTGAMNMGNYAINNIGDISMLGGQKVKYSAKAEDYTLVAGDYIIAVSDLSDSRVMTLPSAATMGAGKVFVIKEQSGGASQSKYIQIMPQSGEQIDGQSDYKVVMPYESVMLVSNGSHWFII